ncbi:hypothetical protein TNCT_540701 [Trichonephila clavata]|uniref:Uncharacterized protein n=1 Tax=Trichonephila clavata TaxID=2740835 RepID=A0A8X6LZB9_TRICU|nr:hypothetical protein TNCT_540701 [Trichonephila clavata]
MEFHSITILPPLFIELVYPPLEFEPLPIGMKKKNKKLNKEFDFSPYLDSGYLVIHSIEEAEVIGLLFLNVLAGFL